ncbi:MAG: glutamate racemase [Spirochaetia bacterium]|nr:MAG: glutamate racemase [Spirochaetia bacterium]
MLGFFDSGLGGLTILKEVIRLMPDYSYIYLGDNARTPYGSHSQDIIYKFTSQGVARLFDEGAKLVVLVCNTSSAAALRRLQMEFLPEHYPDKKVLGVIIPTAEETVKMTNSKEIGILATEATVHSFVYPREITKLDGEIKVHQQACPLLVPIIEAGELEWEGLDLIVKKYVGQLFERSSAIDVLILGCTHYELISDVIKKHVPDSVKIFNQARVIAEKLENYLECHPEISEQLGKDGKRDFLSTEDSWRVKDLFRKFYGEKINPRKVSL